MKAQKGAQSHYSGVFIYKDLKSIEDTNNAITIIILITAIIFYYSKHNICILFI